MANLVKVKAFWFLMSSTDRESVAQHCEDTLNGWLTAQNITDTRFIKSEMSMFTTQKVDGYICAVHIFYTA